MNKKRVVLTESEKTILLNTNSKISEDTLFYICRPDLIKYLSDEYCGLYSRDYAHEKLGEFWDDMYFLSKNGLIKQEGICYKMTDKGKAITVLIKNDASAEIPRVKYFDKDDNLIDL